MQRRLVGRTGQHLRCQIYHRHAMCSVPLSHSPRHAFRHRISMQRHAAGAACRRQQLVTTAAGDGNNVQIGAELLAGRADAKAAMQWREAIVLENRCCGASCSVKSDAFDRCGARISQAMLPRQSRAC